MNSATESTATPANAPAGRDGELLEAYHRTVWSVELPATTVEVRLNGTPADPQLSPGGIVTAYNPASVAGSPEQNREADQELLRHVRSLGIPFRRVTARGEGEWEEPGFYLLGHVRPLLVELGLVFGQNAVVWVDESGAGSLVCTRAGFAGRLPGQKIDL